jgi:hypothetical protein
MTTINQYLSVSSQKAAEAGVEALAASELAR